MMAENPNWWSTNNGMHPQSQQLSSTTNYLSHPSQYPSGSFSLPTNSLADHHAQEFPRSWSQLLLGGLSTEQAERYGDGPFHKKLESWEDQMLNPSFRVPVADHVKQEVASAGGHLYGHVNGLELQPCRPSWSQVMPVSSPSSCITSSSSNSVMNFSTSNAQAKNQHPPDQTSSECNSSGNGGGVSKKARVQHSSAQPVLKVRKEKLGDRITALHQLVSPFGKTDTASVLSEAIGYIRFLQSQIEALSSPYMGSTASGSMGQQHSDSQEYGAPKDLRSRGLCLVPVSCTQHVGNENGADFWAPAFGGGL